MNKKRARKNTKTHLFEVKNYEHIRKFIKALLFYPGMNKESMQETGVITSQRAFYDRLQNITFYMKDTDKKKDEKKVYEYKINHTKYKTILNDLYEYPANYFTDTFMYASYNEEDLFYYIIYMQMINQFYYDDYNFTYNDIEALFPDHLKIKRDILYALEELGIIERIKKRTSKCQYYRLSTDILNYNKNNFLDNLQNMIIFFYNHHYLSVPGYFLSKTINQYKVLYGSKDAICHYNPNDDIFGYRYVPKHNTIDNNILWNILEAVKNKNIIKYTYITQCNSEAEYSMLPIKVVIENEYGKQYCYGYDTSSNQYFLSRIDMMTNIITTDITCNNHEIYKQFDKDFSDKWMTADNTGSYYIRIYFHFPAEKYKILKRYLENTMRFGKITENVDMSITFDITISNYKEIIPWINSFGEYAIVDKNICPELYEDIKQHNNKLREMYGLI